MTEAATENLGSIFVDPAAYADPERWHAAAEAHPRRVTDPAR